MASELSMNGRKKIETLQKEFTKKFPYLTLVFLNKERRAIDISKSLSEVRQAKGDDISIIASLKVNTLEKRFLENFGLVVEVAYQKSNKVVHTKDNVDKTLNELNKWCQVNDCQPFVFKKSFTGNTLLSIQEQLFEAIKEYYPEADAKKINKDNYLDIYVPEINKKRGNHLFFNTAKDGIKIGFYCRDEEFTEEVLSRSSNIEKYAQGIRILNNPLQKDVDEATISALSFIEEITGEQKEKSEEEIDIEAILDAMGYDEEEEDDSTNELDKENYELITALEVFDSETMAMAQMFPQFGITEVGTGSGSWKGNFYTYDYRTEWNEGYLENYDAISIEALIDLLKNKNINDFNQDDIGNLGIGTLRNGNTTYENFKWDEDVSKKDIKNAPDEEELCKGGDIQNSEYLWDSPERIEFVVTEDDKEDLNFILINKNAVIEESELENDTELEEDEEEENYDEEEEEEEEIDEEEVEIDEDDEEEEEIDEDEEEEEEIDEDEEEENDDDEEEEDENEEEEENEDEDEEEEIDDTKVEFEDYTVTKYGFIDKKGNQVIPCIYDSVNNFEGGIARVQQNGQWFYIDKKGNSIFENRDIETSSETGLLKAVSYTHLTLPTKRIE